MLDRNNVLGVDVKKYLQDTAKERNLGLGDERVMEQYRRGRSTEAVDHLPCHHVATRFHVLR